MSAALGVALLASGCGQNASNGSAETEKPAAPAKFTAGTGVEAVDGARIINADSEPGNWMTTGRTYTEQRFSPLTQINDGNVGQLGLAWYVDIDVKRGQEATPIVVDGVMYESTAFSKVMAINAKTGEVLWKYDPKIRLESMRDACCDAVNRGVAVWKGKVYLGALDGRLIAIDAKTGKQVWETQTTPVDEPYTITGAPRIVKGNVIIGNAGAEENTRGYVSAYDAETGKMVWRFYIVPTDPSKEKGNKAMEMAAKTWGDEWWKHSGGGGNSWDGFAYDPELDLLYIPGGNGGPFDRSVRSPGGGTNLFLGSIIAVRPETGEYVWHYQATPGDSWDYDNTQQMILADLTIDGKLRKVLMQAPKNGVFYVIDRETGKFISAKPFIPITWATGFNPDGSPIMNPAAFYMDTGKPELQNPGPAGGHNWMPMSFNPKTGLVYFPAQDTPWIFRPSPSEAKAQKGAGLGPQESAGLPKPKPWSGFLVAWDPVNQKEVWRVDRPGPSNGGTLTTAGNLVFEGDVNGEFFAYTADTGKELWKTDLQSAAMAGPVSYTVDGEQYIAVSVGLGGASALVSGAELLNSGPKQNISRIVAFKVGGKVTLPPAPPIDRELNPPPLTASPQTVAKGAGLFGANCAGCHGMNAIAGILPDLRYTPHLSSDTFYDIVMDGVLQDNGMLAFKNLSKDDVDAIRAYLISRAHETLAGTQTKDLGAAAGTLK